MSEFLKRTYEIVGDHMDDIVALFKPDVKITVLVRTPGYPDRDFLMTSDDLNEVIAAIERRMREAVRARLMEEQDGK